MYFVIESLSEKPVTKYTWLDEPPIHYGVAHQWKVVDIYDTRAEASSKTKELEEERDALRSKR